MKRTYCLKVRNYDSLGFNFLGNNFQYVGLAEIRSLNDIFPFSKEGISLHSYDGDFERFIYFSDLQKVLKRTLKDLSLKTFYAGGEEDYTQGFARELQMLVNKKDFKSIVEHTGFHCIRGINYVKKV